MARPGKSRRGEGQGTAWHGTARLGKAWHGKEPAAYRMASPTQEEMDHVEHLLEVQRGR